ncbi:MAG: hypothetical protein EA358_03775 [Flavobacteriales bacterium]|nr:MAG: hypothetical protein EA358_03775 [Flavobacteriales bacterium]
MNRKLGFLVLSVIILFSPVFVYAQPRPPSVPVPLDGGLVALLIAGAAYGAKKHFNNQAD